MENIFMPTGNVSGDSMIGYERYYKRIQEAAFITNQSRGISVSGMHRVGKTSLMKKMKAEADGRDGYVSIYIDLARVVTSSSNSKMFELMKIVAVDIRDACEEKGFYNPNLISICNSIVQSECDSNLLRNQFLRMIALIGRTHHTILIIDEFDSAKEFKTEDHELLRELFGDQANNCSVFLVSRAQIINIVKDNGNNSTLPQAVKKEYISGFDLDEIGSFYEILKGKYGIALSDEDKRAVYEYAGIIPKWYSNIGYEIVNQHKEGTLSSVADICQSKSNDIFEYYQTVLERLKSDGYMNDIYATVVGPQIGVSRQRFDALRSIGYLTQDKDSDCYIAFAPYFTAFLLNQKMELSSEIEKVLTLEKTIKGIVRDQMSRFGIYPENIDLFERILSKAYSDHGGSYKPEKNRIFIKNNERDFGITCSLLDILSLKDTFYAFVEPFWHTCFAQYFGGDPISKWESKFEDCARARNPLAHGHEDFLTESERAIVSSYCDLIITTIKENSVKVSTRELDCPDWIMKSSGSIH